MMYKNHKGALLVMTDHKTLHSRIKKIADKSSLSVGQWIQRTLANSLYKLNTVTFEKDKTFACLRSVAKTFAVIEWFFRFDRPLLITSA